MNINWFKRRKINSQKAIDKSKAFCMLPWVHLYISTAGKVIPCCLASRDDDELLGDINESSLAEIWNGDEMKAFRSKMLKDEKDKRCWQCYENEELGLRSKRQVSNYCYANKLDWVKQTKRDGYSADAKPIYWDIRISNLCNFKCRICGHHSSSKLYEEAKALGTLSFPQRVHYSMKDFDNVMEQLTPIIPDLEEVYFAGGEPLIMDEHYQILDRLIAAGKSAIKLRYSTNFSITRFKGKDIFELWNQFEEVFVHASLDGSYARGEYQRKGQNWSEVVKERKRMMEICPQVNFMISPAVSVFNVLHLPDFHREWVEKGLVAVDDLIPNTLKNPEEYNIKILPPGLKQRIKERYEEHLRWLDTFTDPSLVKLSIVKNEYKNIITLMLSEDRSHLIPAFQQKCQELDEMRAERTIEIFPELSEVLGSNNF